MRCTYESPESPILALVGEAPGEEEEKHGIPFIGKSGEELTAMLHAAKLKRSECLVTNVFMDRPPGNKIGAWCGTKKETGSKLPPIMKGKYLKPEYEHELERLRMELSNPSLRTVFAFGNTAVWAILNTAPKIGKMRGTWFRSRLVPNLKVMPMYHPAAVLRQWQWRYTTILDMIKAKPYIEDTVIPRPKREFWINPSLDDLYTFKRMYIDIQEDPLLSVDIETNHKVSPWGEYGYNQQITCIGFSPDFKHSLVIPFARGSEEYWKSDSEEYRAWEYTRDLVQSYDTLFQWGFYDVYVLWMLMGIPARRWTCDSSVRQHALYPELPKNLGFLGAAYTKEMAWKLYRTSKGEKKEE